MTMTSQQVVSFARNLAQLRADWDLSGCVSAVTDLAARAGDPFDQQIEALRRAKVASNRTPNSICWAEQYPTHPAILEQERAVCPEHGGTARRTDGRFACCLNDDWWGSDEPIHTARDMPPIVRELFPTKETKCAL